MSQQTETSTLTNNNIECSDFCPSPDVAVAGSNKAVTIGPRCLCIRSLPALGNISLVNPYYAKKNSSKKKKIKVMKQLRKDQRNEGVNEEICLYYKETLVYHKGQADDNTSV